MLGGLVRTNANIEKMLLAPLARIGNALVSWAHPFVLHFHFVARRFAESSMIRRHNSAYPMPAAAAASGRRLASVIPGIVFTSRTLGSPSSGSRIQKRIFVREIVNPAFRNDLQNRQCLFAENPDRQFASGNEFLDEK